MTLTDKAAHSPMARYLPLWTFRGRRENHGRMHLAKVKTTKRPVATSWCGGTYFTPDELGPKTYLTGEEAFLMQSSDWTWTPRTCRRCLDAIAREREW